MDFVSRAGQKLHHALVSFDISPAGLTCADLGCNTGGFTDCLLQMGAKKVYAIDTGYGVLEYKLRKDSRVVVMERTNAMHVTLPELMDLITIDVAWTKQRHILPAALRLLQSDGQVVTLIKPHYEAEAKLLRNGVLPEEHLDDVLETVKLEISKAGFRIEGIVDSPIKGSQGNAEFLAHLKRG
ncbi:MAG TPA: SAM-dependent methyltransferase [Tepidisphaeraceae bacterium]|jgi:23S rRNA (cytidine1920-2'-O)/16S rRNA (cytidine1409-2'-O)-methyltransferase